MQTLAPPLTSAPSIGHFPRNRESVVSVVCSPGKIFREAERLPWAANNKYLCAQGVMDPRVWG